MTLGALYCQTPLSMGFSMQKYWSGLWFPTPGNLSNPAIKSESLKSPTLAGGFFATSATWEAHCHGLLGCCVSPHNTGHLPPKPPYPGLLRGMISCQHWAQCHFPEHYVASAHPSSTSPTQMLHRILRLGTSGADGQAQD